jgi:hypothetical protein
LLLHGATVAGLVRRITGRLNYWNNFPSGSPCDCILRRPQFCASVSV